MKTPELTATAVVFGIAPGIFYIAMDRSRIAKERSLWPCDLFALTPMPRKKGTRLSWQAS